MLYRLILFLFFYGLPSLSHFGYQNEESLKSIQLELIGHEETSTASLNAFFLERVNLLIEYYEAEDSQKNNQNGEINRESYMGA